MALDHERALALQLPAFDVLVERGRLRAFARAIGETDPVFTELDAARAAGHPDLPVPPTFLFSLYLEAPDPWGFLDDLDVDLRGLLHGEQSFVYHRVLHAGDVVSVQPAIAEAYAKNARMDFVRHHVGYRCGDEPVGESDSLLVIREVAAA